MLSVQWFWRVVLWLLIELDIPRLSSDEIQFGDCFRYAYFLQFSSILFLLISSFDATGLERYLSFGNRIPSSTSCVVKNRTQLDSIPMEVEDLWIGRFDTTGLTEYSFNAFQSIQSLVIGNGTFWTVTSFELSNLSQLQSIDIGDYCFYDASSFSLTGLADWLVWIHRSSSTTISQTR